VRFINSLLKPWLNKVGYINEIGCTDEMSYANRIGCIGKVGYRVSEAEVGVLVVVHEVKFLVVLILVLVLAKLFLRR
jgi:hypothetical protein